MRVWVNTFRGGIHTVVQDNRIGKEPKKLIVGTDKLLPACPFDGMLCKH